MDKQLLESHASKGLTIRDIASEEGKSYTSVRYWLQKYDIKTHKMLSNDEIPSDKSLRIIQRRCKKHGLTDYVINSTSTKYQCKKCRVDSVTKRRQEVKRLLVEYKGGKCERCGVEYHPAVYDFHHINPEEKEITLGSNAAHKALSVLKKEVDKCLLLCSNCHREKHVDLW